MKIAIVDQYPIIQTGLTIYLQRLFNDVSIIVASCLEELEDKLAAQTPDVVIIAVTQEQKTSNMELISRCRELFELKRVVIYDEQADFSQLQNYFRAGVYNYISKQSDLKELYNCILEIVGDALVTRHSPVVVSSPHSPRAKLSARELQVALLLSEGIKNNSIAGQLKISASSVSSYKRRVFIKMEVKNIVQLRELMLY